MGTLYENIMRLCERKGIKGAKLCADTGISKGLLTDLKMGRRNGVSAMTAQKIASYFDVSVAYLLTGEEEQKNKPTDNGELSQKDSQLVNWFHSLPKETRQAILTLGAAPKGLDD